jgi:hypothetical protein
MKATLQIESMQQILEYQSHAPKTASLTAHPVALIMNFGSEIEGSVKDLV